jgi:hypothetical protein
MILIHYFPNADHAIPDGKIAAYVDDLLAAHAQISNVVRSTSQGTVIQELRLRVARGELPHTDLQFVFDDHKFSLNEYAVIYDWPQGFADLEDRQVTEILTLAMKKRLKQGAK